MVFVGVLYSVNTLITFVHTRGSLNISAIISMSTSIDLSIQQMINVSIGNGNIIVYNSCKSMCISIRRSIKTFMNTGISMNISTSFKKLI